MPTEIIRENIELLEIRESNSCRIFIETESSVPQSSVPLVSQSNDPSKVQFKDLYIMNSNELKIRSRLQNLYKSKDVEAFVKLLVKNVKILYGRETSEDDSLFEEILSTDNKDHAAFITAIWEDFELRSNVDILKTSNSNEKLPIDYILKSESNMNLICFLVYDFNTPKSVGVRNDINYFLNLKNDQYIDRTCETLFEKLYSMIEEEEKDQEVCFQIIKQYLKEKQIIQDIVKETSIDYVLDMTDIHYITEILKLLVFYWDIERNQDDFIKYKDKLTNIPFCELILELKKETENSFADLFGRYLKKIEKKFEGCPKLHQIELQNDRKYLCDLMILSSKYNTDENICLIDRGIPNNPKLLEYFDDLIFTNLSPKLQKVHKQIMNSSGPKKFQKIKNKLDCRTLKILLLARSEDHYENILERMMKTDNSIYENFVEWICSNLNLKTFYTEEMLLKRNPLGKQLIDYVIESGIERNEDKIMRFFKSFMNNQNSLLVIINEQLKQKRGKTIFQIIYDIIQKHHDYCKMHNNDERYLCCMKVLEQLLIDMVEIVDIQIKCDIQYVLDMSSDEYYKDDILRLLIIYWKIDSNNYDEYKRKLLRINKGYEIIFMLKEENEKKFKDEYEVYLGDESIKKIQYPYNAFLFHCDALLEIAIKNDQQLAIETILENEEINVDKIRVPTDDSLKTFEKKNFLIKLLLKYGYKVEKFNHWRVNPELFNDSMDAKVTEEDENTIVIDYKSCNDVPNFAKRDEEWNLLLTNESILNTHDLKKAAKEINSTTTNLSTEIKNAIKTFTDDIQISFATRNGIPALDVTGHHIVFSEIISRIELLLTDNQTIMMVNFNAIVIHIDVGLSNEIWNGKIIDVIVGKIIVHGSIEWDVSGLNGDTESEDQSQIHGGNGGLVIIEADYIINSSFWTIKANGGNGRDGQEGGQITDGVDGQSVSIDTIKKAVKWVWDECTYGEGTKYTDIDGFSCEYVCHWDGFTKFKLTLCNGKDPIAPKYITAVSIGNPGQSGTIIVNAFNGASSVKRSSVPGQPTITRTIEKKTKIGKRGTDRGAYDQTSKNPVYFHSRSSTLLRKAYQVDNCPYCVWNSKMDYYAFIDEIGNC
ncbi:unnamed protein product [Diamesa tonsa]